jgi:peptide chain release factor subunit 1
VGFGIISGTSFDVIEVITSGVSGKHRAGGQSARRFERLRQMELTGFFNRIASHSYKIFIEEYSIKGLVISGPGPTKDDFLKGEFLDYRLQKNILGVIDTSYAGSEGVRETLERSGNILEKVRLVEEKKFIQRFLKEVNLPEGLATYSIREVQKSLKRGNVDIVLVSDDIDHKIFKAICKKCNWINQRIVETSKYVNTRQELSAVICQKCGNNSYDLQEQDFIEYLDEIAQESGAKVEVISSKTEEGVMLKSFGGIGALLRFR